MFKRIYGVRYLSCCSQQNIVFDGRRETGWVWQVYHVDENEVQTIDAISTRTFPDRGLAALDLLKWEADNTLTTITVD